MARRTRSARRTRADQGAPGEIGRAPVVDGYTDLEVIGRGASATVYRANQEGYDRHVAIKVLNVDMSDRRARRRFDRERSVNGRLSHHPNVVTVLESGLIDGRQPYLAMELYEKGSLADRLVEQGPFGVDVVLHHMIRVAGALESAHRLGVLHRDIKPHNILLSNYGEPALADFGIASILDAEPSMTAALTVTHAPPELLEGEQPTPQSDVYALGSTMYTLLAGSTPLAGSEVDGVNKNPAGYVADVASTAFSASTTAFMIAPNPVTAGLAIVTGVVWAGAEIVDHWDEITEWTSDTATAVSDTASALWDDGTQAIAGASAA